MRLNEFTQESREDEAVSTEAERGNTHGKSQTLQLQHVNDYFPLTERSIKLEMTQEIKVCFVGLSRDTFLIKTGLINNHSKFFLMPKFGSVISK